METETTHRHKTDVLVIELSYVISVIQYAVASFRDEYKAFKQRCCGVIYAFHVTHYQFSTTFMISARRLNLC